MPGPAPYDEYATPTLMRAARGAYAQSIRAHLLAAGFDDLPKNGSFILAGVDGRGGPLGELPDGLEVTKQALSLSIDALVNRGYLNRQQDPADRRRNLLELTERGRRAVEAVVAGLEEIDRLLAEEVSPEEYRAMRKALAAMARLKIGRRDAGSSRRQVPRMLEDVSPIFPVRHLRPALEHYHGLGFKVIAYEGGDHYGFAERDKVGLHLMTVHDHDSEQSFGCCYLFVRDADALYEEWTRPGLGGTTHRPVPTPYKLKEGRHTDPDGNLIRFGSWLADSDASRP